MNRRFMLGLAAVFALGACSDAPTDTSETPAPDFITDGTLDGNKHPAVVLVLMEVLLENEKGQLVSTPRFRCSGTLIAPKVVLTAGHCTGEPGEFSAIRIFTESDVENGDNNYPFGDKDPKNLNTIEAVSWESHPKYTNAAFFLHDVGVIKLKDAFNLSSSHYGKLPSRDQLDALQPRSSTLFTAVGYGLQRINPAQVEAERVRMLAEPHLVQINTGLTGDFSLLLSNNASTGGTCFGDSGGPNYLGSSNVIAGVTSFGLNGTCGGTGGVFRMDRQDVLDFVGKFLK
jgi:hypothetical protein